MFDVDINQQLQFKVESCTKCGLCTELCLRKAVDLDSFTFNNGACNRCMHCLALCPAGAIEYKGELTASLPEMAFSADSFELLSRRRRSTRRFKERAVERGVVERIVDNLRYSPTASNMQGVELTIVEGSKSIDALNLDILGYYDSLTKGLSGFTSIFYRLFFPKAIIEKLYQIRGYMERFKAGENLISFNAPLVFIFHAPDRVTTPHDDCNIATTIAMLHAETCGLGSCFNGIISNAFKRSKSLRERYAIPAGNRVYAALLLGYPAVSFKRDVVRKGIKVKRIDSL